MEVERLVPEDHEARAIWEFVGRLDLGRYYESIEVLEGEAGRSALDPRLMISLWIYAYSKGVGSAREISRLYEYDPAPSPKYIPTSISSNDISDKHLVGLFASIIHPLLSFEIYFLNLPNAVTIC